MQRRRLALLIVLAAARHRPVPRDRLIALFWPDQPGDDARHALAQLVYGVRKELGEQSLISGADDLRLNAAVVSADIADFDDAVDRGELERAAALASGVFLDAFYVGDAPELERWVETERERVRMRRLDLLAQLARSAARAGTAADAVRWWRERLVLDPLLIETTIELMTALEASGEIAVALQQGRIHEALMRQELDAPPDPRITSIADRLRSQLTAAIVPVLVPPGQSSPEPTPLATTTQPRRQVALIATAATMAALVIALAAASRGLRDRALPGEAPRRVVLGTVHGPDTLLDIAVREAVRAQLESTTGVRVLGDAQSRDALQLMRVPEDAELSDARTMEVAQRTGSPLVVLLSVRPLGAGTQLVARVVDARDGSSTSSFIERAASSNELLPAVSRLALAVARRLADTPAGDATVPLPAITTSSLFALKSFALARRLRGSRDPSLAVQYLESALDADSTFALAHYLLADALWFDDHQQQSELHFARALALADKLPLRERLVIRARYEQLVADRPDSALAYWQRLIAQFPQEALGYEGMSWAYRATNRYAEAAAAADTALQLDSLALLPSATNRLYALLDGGDTTTALAFAQRMRAKLPFLDTHARFQVRLRAREWRAAYEVVKPNRPPTSSYGHSMRHVALLAQGKFDESSREMRIIQDSFPRRQVTPRALLLQAWAELERGGSRARAGQTARSVLAWIEAADLSAPAIARLTERVAELGARAGDRSVIEASRRLLERRDAGRQLRSYQLATYTVRAADALASGDARSAAHLAEVARLGAFHGRSMSLLALLEADARVAIGDTAVARQLYTALLTPDAFAGDDVETWAAVQPISERRLASIDVAPARR
jgi:DNA-binding SARP family transcriptional activator/tetratricopeptide (TPR) repeat protein